jgi:Methane oxygenase PmoA
MKHSLPALLLFAAVGIAADKPGFAWKDAEGEHPVLTYDGKPVLEYVHPKFDKGLNAKSKDGGISNPTTKIYHHLYDETGTVRLTNGPEGQYPHHRGIFFGFNKVVYDGKPADVWHCKNGESERHEAFLDHKAGPDSGSHKIRVSWNGTDNAPFAEEERELAVAKEGNGWRIDFTSKLTALKDKVRLDGDPQHAGFHFRANVEVEKTKGETYFLRPDGKGENGKEVNWEPKGKSGPTNRPWTAMSFVVEGKRYTCVYLDHPDNPKEARQSERTYGRVGTYFEYDLTKDKPLTVHYRLWVGEREVTAEQCEAMSKKFVEATKGK